MCARGVPNSAPCSERVNYLIGSIKLKAQIKWNYLKVFEYAYEKPKATTRLAISISPTNLSESQKGYIDFAVIYQYLDKGKLPKNKTQALKVVAKCDQDILDDGVLFHLCTARTQSVPREQSINS